MEKQISVEGIVDFEVEKEVTLWILKKYYFLKKFHLLERQAFAYLMLEGELDGGLIC